MTYKTTSDLSQRRLRQLWLSDLQGKAFEELPKDQQRANLVLAKESICKKLKEFPPKSKERKELGAIQHDMDERIHALRPKLRGAPTVTTHFMDVCRERMNPFLFKTYMNEASIRASSEEAAA